MLTYGFFNSSGGDRKYTAEQMSDIFDQLLTPGVLETFGNKFFTIPQTSGLGVIVRTGWAWFDQTWTKLDADLPFQIDVPDLSLSRIDTVAIVTNKSELVRANHIEILKGIPSVVPTPAAYEETAAVHIHPIAYVTVRPDAEQITSSDIEILVGKAACPFITSVLQATDITTLFNAWDEQFQEWFEHIQSVLSEEVVTNLYAEIEKRVKIADKATTSEAQAGTNNTKWMTPATTKAATNQILDTKLHETGSQTTSSIKTLPSVKDFAITTWGGYGSNTTAAYIASAYTLCGEVAVRIGRTAMSTGSSNYVPLTLQLLNLKTGKQRYHSFTSYSHAGANNAWSVKTLYNGFDERLKYLFAVAFSPSGLWAMTAECTFLIMKVDPSTLAVTVVTEIMKYVTNAYPKMYYPIRNFRIIENWSKTRLFIIYTYMASATSYVLRYIELDFNFSKIRDGTIYTGTSSTTTVHPVSYISIPDSLDFYFMVNSSNTYTLYKYNLSSATTSIVNGATSSQISYMIFGVYYNGYIWARDSGNINAIRVYKISVSGNNLVASYEHNNSTDSLYNTCFGWWVDTSGKPHTYTIRKNASAAAGFSLYKYDPTTDTFVMLLENAGFGQGSEQPLNIYSTLTSSFYDDLWFFKGTVVNYFTANTTIVNTVCIDTLTDNIYYIQGEENSSSLAYQALVNSSDFILLLTDFARPISYTNKSYNKFV